MNGRNCRALDIESSGPLGEDPLAAGLEECPVGNGDEPSSSPPPASPQPPLPVLNRPCDLEEASKPRAIGGGAEISSQVYPNLLSPLALCPFNAKGGPDLSQREGRGRLFVGGTTPARGSSEGLPQIVGGLPPAGSLPRAFEGSSRAICVRGVPLPPRRSSEGHLGVVKGQGVTCPRGIGGGSLRLSEGLLPADCRRSSYKPSKGLPPAGPLPRGVFPSAGLHFVLPFVTL